MEGKYLVDHLLGWIRWPYLSANAGIWYHLFSGTVYWICGSSFTVGEVADCPVAKTVSPTSPTTAASHIPTSASTFPRARKVISNSADLVTKLVDPPIISLRKSMRLNSTLRCSRSTPNQRNESILVLKSALVSSLQFCGESLLGLPLVLMSIQEFHPDQALISEQSPRITPPSHLPVTILSCTPDVVAESAATVTLSQDAESAATVTLSQDVESTATITLSQDAESTATSSWARMPSLLLPSPWARMQSLPLPSPWARMPSLPLRHLEPGCRVCCYRHLEPGCRVCRYRHLEPGCRVCHYRHLEPGCRVCRYRHFEPGCRVCCYRQLEPECWVYRFQSLRVQSSTQGQECRSQS